jgi:hypothetical protein
MQARGARVRVGNNLYAGGTATVAGPVKTTKELARETGLAERTYRKRTQIGRELTEETLTSCRGASRQDHQDQAWVGCSSRAAYLFPLRYGGLLRSPDLYSPECVEEGSLEVRCAGVPWNVKILLPFLTEALPALNGPVVV